MSDTELSDATNHKVSTPAGRAPRPARIEIIIQHGAELVILGLALVAVCISTSTLTPWNGILGSSGLKSWLTKDVMLHIYGFVCGAAILIPLTWLAYRGSLVGALTRILRLGTCKPLIGISILGMLLLAGVYCYLWPRMFPAPYRPNVPSDATVGINVVDTQIAGALICLLVLLCLSRLCRRPRTFYLAALIALGLALGGRYWFSVRPVILKVMHEFDAAPQIINQITNQNPFRPGITVSALVMPLGSLLQILVPLLAALYAIRRGFAWWKVLLGWLLGWLPAYAILFLSLPPANLAAALTVATNLVLLFLLLRLPLQRRALERLAGLSLTGRPEPRETSGAGVLEGLLRHAILILIILGFAVFAVIGTAENRMAQMMINGLPMPRYSPARVNAYTVMKPWFDRKQSRALNLRMSDEYNLLEGLGGASRPLLDEIKPLIDPAKIENDINSLNPALELYVRAAGADYCLFQEPGRAVTINYVNLRIVARALLVRANLRIIQGRPAEALQDIATNLKIAWLMNGDPNGNLVEYMIATAIRGIAIAAAQNYFNYYRQDPAALDQLRALLERDARLVRIDFPSDPLSRTEAGFWPVAPYFEVGILDLTAPDLIKAGSIFYQQWANYDVLYLATALEAYRHDQGRYPDRLEQLAPKHLATLPREPLDGQPYIYENLDTNFRLSYPVAGEAARKQIDFSTVVQENSGVRQSLDKLKAQKNSSAGSSAR